MRLTSKNGNYCDDCGGHCDDYCRCDPEIALYEKLKQYEDAEEQGLLVRLPCKVGDTVYLLERFCDGSIGDCDSWVSCEECDDYKQQINPCRIVSIDAAFAVIGMLGKTVFLTREAAEAALKGEIEVDEKMEGEE